MERLDTFGLAGLFCIIRAHEDIRFHGDLYVEYGFELFDERT